MSSPSDPIRSWRLRRLATWLVGGIATVAAGVWAVAPVHLESPAHPELRSEAATEAATQVAQSPLPAELFSVQLWNPPPPPPKPEHSARTAARSDPPPDLQLIGIVRDDDIRRAVLYDPKTAQLHIVADGETVTSFTVVAVTDQSVQISNGRRTTELRLRERPS